MDLPISAYMGCYRIFKLMVNCCFNYYFTTSNKMFFELNLETSFLKYIFRVEHDSVHSATLLEKHQAQTDEQGFENAAFSQLSA